jgi:hypothetical protein
MKQESSQGGNLLQPVLSGTWTDDIKSKALVFLFAVWVDVYYNLLTEETAVE